MWEIVEFENHYQVKKEDGRWLSTFSSQNEIEPFKWDKKYHSREFVSNVVKDFWNKETF